MSNGGILTGRGVNSVKKILDSSYNTDNETRDIQTSSAFPVFFRAVVVDVLSDPEALSDEEKEELKNNLSNPFFIDKAPKNSILSRIISGGLDHIDSSIQVLYPFFPPHLSLPVKPGEQVWVFFEEPNASFDLGYWISRPSEQIHIDDINFTHGDRKYQNDEEAKGGIADTEGNSFPNFPNGGGNEDDKTLKEDDEYETIEKFSEANKIITKEAVPRFTKRPADLVLQGSNNALISLGEDRRGKLEKETDEKKNQAGTIDIVVGRGKNLPPSDGVLATQNAPATITNSRGQKEVDKNPINKNKTNKSEGNPDFSKDSSRIYLSMNTNGDVNFNLAGKLPALNNDTPILPIENGAYAVVKSDEIRIIARKDDTDNKNGSIKIVKEGGEDQAVIVLEKSGDILINNAKSIMIDGNEIFLKKDSTEKAVLGNTLVDIMKEFISASDTSITAGNIGNLGAPIPALVGIKTALSVLDGNLDTILSEFTKLK